MIKISIDNKNLKATLLKFSKELNKDVADSIIEMGQSCAKGLAHRIQPFGLTKKSQDILQHAVYKDVGKAYQTIGGAYTVLKERNQKLAIGFLRSLENNDLMLAEKYASNIGVQSINKSDSGSYLQSLRNRKGRVSKKQPMILTDRNSIQDIKEDKAVTAGTAKAGWIQAGISIGSKFRVPKWLKRSNTIGYGTIIRNGVNTIVNLYNNVRYASDVLPQSQINIAMVNAYKFQLQRMKKQIEALIKKNTK